MVQDIYDDTDSALLATVFLPVVPGIKKEGTVINTERRLSAIRPVLPKTENEKNDLEALLGMGDALGLQEELKRWRTARDIFNLMKECSRGMPCDITGVDYDALAGSKGIQWPYAQTNLKNKIEYETKFHANPAQDVERRLFEDGNYYTPSKKAKFIFEKPREDTPKQSAKFPYFLNTGRGTVGQWHTQTRTREVAYISDVNVEKAHVFINTQLAKEKNIADNDLVELASYNGQTAVFLARLTNDVDYEQIYAPLHYIETNKLTLSLYDNYSKEPSYKYAPVALRKVTS
jgi:assimilatory nitrate reductase catalytic subunit